MTENPNSTSTISSATLRRRALSIGSTATLLGGSAGALFLALAASPAGAVGNTFTVDTLDDGPDNASDCTIPVAGSCSLRDAITAASDGDTIVFEAGLTGTITLYGAQIEIGSEITVLGPGPEDITIDAGGESRVFYLCAGPAVEISGVTITGGSANRGGGLYDECNDGFTLRDVVVTGNEATGQGGGGLRSGGVVTLIDSVVSNNSANGNGGGILAEGVVLQRTTISGNYASGSGGGITSSDSVIIEESDIVSNASDVGGGGVHVMYADVSIDRSTFKDNTARFCGGGLYVGGRGLYDDRDVKAVDITSSTFSGNAAQDCYGGAIDLDGNNLSVVIANTTITGNSAVSGGGLHVDYDNTVDFIQSTIVGNYASSTDPLYSGGGVHFNENAALTFSGSIVSGNTASVDGAADIGYGRAKSLYTRSVGADHSMIGEVDSRVAVLGDGYIRSTSPGVGNLADNGGPTLTMALDPTSEAVDAGLTVMPPFPGDLYDQRGVGFARIVGMRSDMGAYEIQSDPDEPTTTTTAGGDPVVPEFTG